MKERDRRDAILALPEANGREDMAKALAAAQGMTVPAAKAMLLKIPARQLGYGDDDANELARRRLGANDFRPNAAGLQRSPGRDIGGSSLLANMKRLVDK